MKKKSAVEGANLEDFDRYGKLVTKLLREHNVTRPPVPVQEIAEREGIIVRFQPFHGTSDVSAVLKRDGAKAVIGVNSSHSLTRQRFSLAHELGHYFLHDETLFVDFGEHLRRPRERFRNTISSQATDIEEVQANQFAATLLMPLAMIQKSFVGLLRTEPDIAPDLAVQRLASDFRVSKQAMEFRLLNLGYLVKLGD